jgi:CheY-like chemotaxis protein
MVFYVLEDSDEDYFLMNKYFRSLAPDFKNLRFENGTEMIQKLESLKIISHELPDLIILDINVPKINGLEVLRHIKNDTLLKMIPTIMFTSSSGRSDVLSAYSIGANSYITKPYDLKEYEKLVTLISEYWAKTEKAFA